MPANAIKSRTQYLFSTIDIMLEHPLFGVGYAGFYDAVTRTDAYQGRWGCREDSTSGREGSSNPHNTFLYYASANGIPGLFISLFLFWSLMLVFWRYFARHGRKGVVFWAAVAAAYVVYVATVPSLLNTALLYLPAAVVIARSDRDRAESAQPAQAETCRQDLPMEKTVFSTDA